MLKYENFEMEKYKSMNELVLNEEKNVTILDIAKKLMIHLDESIERFKLVAK
jgi:hypothetical protein